jgi:hypothetical protein
VPIATLYGKSFQTEKVIMNQKLNGVSTPVRQEDLWASVRFAAVLAKTWKGEERKRKGLTIYGVQVLCIFHPEARGFGNAGDYITVNVPMTEEDFTKLSHEKQDTLLQFEGLVSHFYNGIQSYGARSVSPARAAANIQLPKA